VLQSDGIASARVSNTVILITSLPTSQHDTKTPNSQALLAKLRNEMHISTDLHRAFLTDLLRMKSEGTLSPSSSPPALPPTIHGVGRTSSSAMPEAAVAAVTGPSTQPPQPQQLQPNRKRPQEIQDDLIGYRKEKKVKMVS
jgi:hypothetical protein